MARISGVDLPREKRVEIGLTYIYGIGRATSNKILAEAAYFHQDMDRGLGLQRGDDNARI